MSCGIGRRCGSDSTLLWLWRRPVATAQIGPLAWGPPHAEGAALEKAKRQKTKNPKKPQRSSFLAQALPIVPILSTLCFMMALASCSDLGPRAKCLGVTGTYSSHRHSVWGSTDRIPCHSSAEVAMIPESVLQTHYVA